MLRASSFTFGSYSIDAADSTVRFTYVVELENGKKKTYTDELILENIPPHAWEEIPKEVLTSTLEALLIMLGINYWAAFPTSNMRIEGFSLSKEQADFWNSLYLNGMAEFFYLMKMDFEGLVKFPFDPNYVSPPAPHFPRPSRSLLLNGAGKDSILSAEMLKEAGVPFDFFAFAPSPAHERIGELAGAKTIRVRRRRDPSLSWYAMWNDVSAAYPSVSTFTFIAVLLSELLGYDSIVFSNEKSADIGNLTYLGLPVNHQWCKSTEAEEMTNKYIQRHITPDIRTSSLLRPFTELEIVKRFARYPAYHMSVTSCNSYFCLTPLEQLLARTPYWCGECPKCVFLFACFAAFLPKQKVVRMFGANLFAKKSRLPYIKRILGIEGFKPLDCVGEPEEMILAMHYAAETGEYDADPAIRMFRMHFPKEYDFASLEKTVLTNLESPPQAQSK